MGLEACERTLKVNGKYSTAQILYACLAGRLHIVSLYNIRTHARPECRVTAQATHEDYTQQLQALASRLPITLCSLPLDVQDIVSPLKADVWAQELASHPNQPFSDHIIRGLQEGFRIGFNYPSSQLRSKGCNMLSATDHPQVVDEYLALERSLGRVGAIPKPTVFGGIRISGDGINLILILRYHGISRYQYSYQCTKCKMLNLYTQCIKLYYCVNTKSNGQVLG